MNFLVKGLIVIFSFLISEADAASTPEQLREILSTRYGSGAAKRAGEVFAQDYNIGKQEAIDLVIAYRLNRADLSEKISIVLSLLNPKSSSYSTSRPTPPSASSHAAPPPSASSHHHQSQHAPSDKKKSDQDAREEEERARKASAQKAEDLARAQAVEASRLEAQAEKERRRAAKDSKKNKDQAIEWMRETVLIGSDRAAVAGFQGITNRLDVFNPLYGNNFMAAPETERKAFPNVPIIHQYDPWASSAGAFFPLVVKIPTIPMLQLPDPVKTTFSLIKACPECEVYWTVQLIDSVSATGRGVADNIVFRPQYWAQPSGTPIRFVADVHLVDPEGIYHHLPSTTYSIHDGVASPNAPVIPFQDRLRAGNGLSFWSLVKNGQRTALSLHWVLANGNDITRFTQAIDRSTTLEELMTSLHHERPSYSPATQGMIDEIETIFWQR